MVLYKRELILNVSFLIFANLLIKPYYIFFVERKIQNEVGTSAWGIYFTLFSLSMLPQILLDLGLTGFVNQRLSAHRDLLPGLWQDTIWLKPVLALIFSFVFLVLAWLGGYVQQYQDMISWIMVNQILISGILFFRAFVSGLGYYRWDSLMSVADKLIFIFLFSLGILFNRVDSIHSFLWIQSISLSIPCLVAGIWLFLFTGVRFKSIQIFKIKKILHQSLPFAGIFVLMVLYCRMEPVWIGLLTRDGAVQSGIYAAAYRLLDAANMMGFLFAGLLLPMFSHAIARKETLEYQSVFDLAAKVMISFAVLVSITVLSQHRYIMGILYKDTYPDILNIVIINLIPMTINYLLSTLLTAAGRAKTMNFYFLISITVNIVSHLILTPRFGATGAAYVAFITQLVTTGLLSYLIHTSGLIRFSSRHYLPVLSSIAIMLFFVKLTAFVPGPALFKVIILFVISFLSFIILGILPVKSIITLVGNHPVNPS